MFEKEAEEYADKDFGMYEPTDHERYAKETDWRNGAEFGYNKAKEELTGAIKLLITTLNDTLWDEGHTGYSDSEPSYKCPHCSCKDCYRVSCTFNESEFFKKLYKYFPELHTNKEVSND